MSTRWPAALFLLLPLALAWSADPPATRRSAPVDDISRAAVYTINELIDNDAALQIAGRVPSDVLIRGWFKWHHAPDYAKLAPIAARAHAGGSLFGAGVTVSALYEGENGLTKAQVDDMATRDPAGNLVDAWKNKGVRHGTLSNPKYRDYVLSWCLKQIDAGANYLFMDEINAVLHHNEGFDDYSNNDFRAFLLDRFAAQQKWPDTDPRWKSELGIDLSDKSIAPDGTMRTFDYRAFLKAGGFTGDPHLWKNPLAKHWLPFRTERDDAAWKEMCDKIRAHAAKLGRKVYLSGNGLAKFVDLQVLGVWGLWRVKDGHVDFSDSQILDWASTVRAGRALAEKKTPVVFFHDWGFDGFPYLKVTPAQRSLWNRIRGAEIYAAGAFYAFPVRGPFGCDAAKDGTLDEIARQAAFYQKHRALYLDADFRGIDCLGTLPPLISASLWTQIRMKSMEVVVHVVNRKVEGGKIVPRSDVAITLPTTTKVASVEVISPDWDGARPARVERVENNLRLILPQFDVYAIAVLRFERWPELRLSPDRTVPVKRWERPARSEFAVDNDGQIRHAADLPGILQGRLHAHMANPPVFTVDAVGFHGKLLVQVQSVATTGARIECLIDGQPAAGVDLPDLDRKNDTTAHEYDRVLEFQIPDGRHRITLTNTGADWASLGWIRFDGRFADPKD